MTAAITAAGVAVVGSAIVANQQRQAAKGAANAQKSAINAASDVERERLQMEYEQYQQQMAEYQRRQAMIEKQQAQTIQNLAPYMQAGQGALYEMLALTGIAAPQGATMPETTAPIVAGGGLRAMGPAQTTPTTPGKMGILGGLSQNITGAQPGTAQQPLMSPAAQEFEKGGLSLASARWQNVSPDASPRAAAAHMYQQVKAEMPNAAEGQIYEEAINRLNAQQGGIQQAAAMEQAQEQVPTVTPTTSPYAGMTGAEAQQTAIQRVAESPLLQELMAQGETGILQNASATGGLRGGRTQAALAQFRPAMLQQEIDKLYGRLQGISGIGQQSILGAPTGTGTGIPTYSGQSQIPNLLTQGGASQAGNILSQAQVQQNLLQDVGTAVGWGMEKYSQGGFFPKTSNTGFGGTTASSTGNYALNMP